MLGNRKEVECDIRMITVIMSVAVSDQKVQGYLNRVARCYYRSHVCAWLKRLEPAQAVVATLAPWCNVRRAPVRC